MTIDPKRAPWYAALLLAASLLALTACGGGGDDDVDRSAEPLMAVPVYPTWQAAVLDVSAMGPHPDLVLNGRGQLLHPDGSRVLAWPDDPGGEIAAAPELPIRMAYAVTHWLRPALNFDSRDMKFPEEWPLDPADEATFTASETYRLWLPDGQSRKLRLLFRAACVPAVSWGSIVPSPDRRSPCGDTGVTVNAVLDGRLVGRRLAIGFNAEGSEVVTDNPVLTLTAAEAGLPHDIVLDFRNSTHFGSPFGLAELQSDGHDAGRLTEAWVDGDRQLQLRYDNGVQIHGPRLALNGAVSGGR